MKLLSYLLLVVTFLSCSQKKEDILLVKGQIVTMNPEQPLAEAMLIASGKIIAVGNYADLVKKASNEIDHSGKVILPGFVDSHVHALEFGEQNLKASVEGCLKESEMVDRLKSFFPNPAPGEWLLGYGWDEGIWAGQGYPDRELLDEAFPHNPVRLQSLHGFASFYNGKALQIAGIDANSAEPVVGRILRRANGEPTGTMETSAQGLVNIHIPKQDKTYYQKAIIKGLETIAAQGVSSVHEAGIKRETIAAWMELAHENLLPIRVYGMLDGNDTTLLEEWFKKGPYTPEEGFLWIKGIKIFYDGSLGSRTALLRDPYSDHPHLARMTERISLERIEEIAWEAAEKGFQLAIHTIGDEANDKILGLFEKVSTAHPEKDLRWRLEHAQVVLPDFYERAAKIKAIVSMQSSHAVGDSKWAEDRLGEERILHAYAWRKMIHAGIPFVLNSDLPGEPWHPIQTFYFAVTRKDLNGNPPNGWYAQEVLTKNEALRAMTIDGASAAFQEAHIGSLSVGKWADFVVLSDNPLDLEEDQLLSIQVHNLYLQGLELK